MTPKTVCILCERKRPVYADKKQWLIHLAGHREDMIRYIVDNFSSCVLCSYPKQFKDKESAASHLRWAHQKKNLIDWIYKNFVTQ